MSIQRKVSSNDNTELDEKKQLIQLPQSAVAGINNNVLATPNQKSEIVNSPHGQDEDAYINITNNKDLHQEQPQSQIRPPNQAHNNPAKIFTDSQTSPQKLQQLSGPSPALGSLTKKRKLQLGNSDIVKMMMIKNVERTQQDDLNWRNQYIQMLVNQSKAFKSAFLQFIKKTTSTQQEDDNRMRKKKEQQELEQKILSTFDNLCFLRVAMRCTCHLLILFILVSLLIGYYFQSYQIGTFTSAINPSTVISFNISNCLLTIVEDHGITDDSLMLDYKIHKEVYPFKGDLDLATMFEANSFDNGNVVEVRAISAFNNTKYCNLKLRLPSKFTDIKKPMATRMNQFNLRCLYNGTCVVVVDTALNFQKVKMTTRSFRSRLMANILKLNTSMFEFSVLGMGNLMLQDTVIQTSALVNIPEGQAILQTQQDILLNWLNRENQLCMSSPYMQHDMPLPQPGEWNCKISKNSDVGILVVGQYDPLSQTQCEGMIFMCKRELCEITYPTILIRVDIGSINVNLEIDDSLYSASMTMLCTEAFDNDTIGFSSEIVKDLAKIEEKSTTAAEPIWIFDIGYKDMQSTTSSLWVFSTNPSYSIMRPYWLSTFSLYLLTTYEYKLAGHLSPGFCPYTSSLEAENYKKISDLIKSKLGQGQRENARINFIQDVYNPLPTKFSSNQTGISLYRSNERIKEEHWVEVEMQENEVHFNYLQYSSQTDIAITLVLSICVSGLITIIFLCLLLPGLQLLNNLLTEKAGHFSEYSKLSRQERLDELTIGDSGGGEVGGDRVGGSGGRSGQSFRGQTNQDEDAIILMDNDNDNSGPGLSGGQVLTGSQANQSLSTQQQEQQQEQVPSIGAALDYYAYLIFQSHFTNSAEAFFEVFMRRITPREEEMFLLGELDDKQYLEMSGKDLKYYYEKFCFLNRLTEINLSDVSVKTMLENKYGYTFEEDLEANQVFTKIARKRNPLSPEQSSMLNQRSVDIFMHSVYEVTGREFDEVWVSDFRQQYSDFCKRYRIQETDFQVSELAKQYDFAVKIIHTEKLVIKKNIAEGLSLRSLTKAVRRQADFFIKLFGMRVDNGDFLVDKQLIKLHIEIMTDPIHYAYNNLRNLKKSKILKYQCLLQIAHFLNARFDYNLTQQEEAFINTIYNNKWMLVDVLIVTIHFLWNVLLTMPLLVAIAINELSYSNYSLQDPQNLIQSSEFSHNIMYIPFYIQHMGVWHYAASIVLIVFIAAMFLDQCINILMTKFPMDRAYEEEKKPEKQGYYKIVQWILFILLAAFAVFYISLIMMWLLLGAIINPNYYLVYSSSVVTLVTFTVQKYNEFNSLVKQGLENVQQILIKEYGKRVQNIFSFLEKEKSKIISQSQNFIDLNSQFAQTVANSVGLGPQAMALKEQVDQIFKEADELSLQDLDPERVKNQAANLKANITESMKTKLRSQFLQNGVGEDVADAFFNIIFPDAPITEENCGDKGLVGNNSTSDVAIELLADKMQTISEGKLPKTLIKWIMKKLLEKKQKIMDFDALGRDAINMVMDVVLEVATQGQPLSPSGQQRIKSLLENLVSFKDIVEEKNCRQFITLLKDIIYSIALFLGKDLTYDESGAFLMKFLHLMSAVVGGDTSVSSLKRMLVDIFQFLNVPDEVGLFLTLIPGQRFSSVYDFGQIKLQSIQQLRQVLEIQIFPKLFAVFEGGNEQQTQVQQQKQATMPTQTPQQLLQFMAANQINVNKVASWIFVAAFKLLGQENDFSDEITELKKFFYEAFSLYHEREGSREPPQRMEEIFQLVEAIPYLINSQINQEYILSDVAAASNFSKDIITELVFLSTKDYWRLFSESRVSSDVLLNSQILSQFALNLRIARPVLLGFLALFYQEYDSIFINDFIEFVCDNQQVKDTQQKFMIHTIIGILKSPSPWEVKTIFQQFQEKTKIKAPIIELVDAYVETMGHAVEKIQREGDSNTQQVVDFLTPSFYQIVLNEDTVLDLDKQLISYRNSNKGSTDAAADASYGIGDFNVRKNTRLNSAMMVPEVLVQDPRNSTSTAQGHPHKIQVDIQDFPSSNQQSSTAQKVQSLSLHKQQPLQSQKTQLKKTMKTIGATDLNFRVRNLKDIKHGLKGLISQSAGKEPLFNVNPRICIKIIKMFGSKAKLSAQLVEVLISLVNVVNMARFKDQKEQQEVIATFAKQFQFQPDCLRELFSLINLTKDSKQNLILFFEKNRHTFSEAYSEQAKTTSRNISPTVAASTANNAGEGSTSNINIAGSLNMEQQQSKQSWFDVYDFLQKMNSRVNQENSKVLKMLDQKMNPQSFFGNLKLFSKKKLFQLFLQKRQGGRISFNEEEILQVLLGLPKLQQLVQTKESSNIIQALASFLMQGKCADFSGLYRVLGVAEHLRPPAAFVQQIEQVIHSIVNREHAKTILHARAVLDRSLTGDKARFIGDLLSTTLLLFNAHERYSEEEVHSDLHNFGYYLPNLMFYFTNQYKQFSKFAFFVCRDNFRFDSLMLEQIEAIFSIFGYTPDIDQAAQLLQVDSPVLEVVQLISCLIFQTNKNFIIQRMKNNPALQSFCLQKNLKLEEVVLLFKIAFQDFVEGDIEGFLQVFKLEKDIDINIVKGIFAYICPLHNFVEKVSPDILINQYVANSQLRQYFYNKLVEKLRQNAIMSNGSTGSSQTGGGANTGTKPGLSSGNLTENILTKEDFNFFELFFCVSKGRWLNIMYQLEETETARDLQFFNESSSKFNELLTAIIGYCQLLHSDDVSTFISLEEIEEKCQSYTAGTDSARNNWIGALYYMSKHLKIGIRYLHCPSILEEENSYFDGLEEWAAKQTLYQFYQLVECEFIVKYSDKQQNRKKNSDCEHLLTFSKILTGKISEGEQQDIFNEKFFVQILKVADFYQAQLKELDKIVQPESGDDNDSFLPCMQSIFSIVLGRLSNLMNDIKNEQQRDPQQPYQEQPRTFLDMIKEITIYYDLLFTIAERIMYINEGDKQIQNFMKLQLIKLVVSSLIVSNSQSSVLNNNASLANNSGLAFTGFSVGKEQGIHDNAVQHREEEEEEEEEKMSDEGTQPRESQEKMIKQRQQMTNAAMGDSKLNLPNAQSILLQGQNQNQRFIKVAEDIIKFVEDCFLDGFYCSRINRQINVKQKDSMYQYIQSYWSIERFQKMKNDYIQFPHLKIIDPESIKLMTNAERSQSKDDFAPVELIQDNQVELDDGDNIPLMFTRPVNLALNLKEIVPNGYDLTNKGQPTAQNQQQQQLPSQKDQLPTLQNTASKNNEGSGQTEADRLLKALLHRADDFFLKLLASSNVERLQISSSLIKKFPSLISNSLIGDIIDNIVVLQSYSSYVYADNKRFRIMFHFEQIIKVLSVTMSSNLQNILDLFSICLGIIDQRSKLEINFPQKVTNLFSSKYTQLFLCVFFMQGLLKNKIRFQDIGWIYQVHIKKTLPTMPEQEEEEEDEREDADGGGEYQDDEEAETDALQRQQQAQIKVNQGLNEQEKNQFQMNSDQYQKRANHSLRKSIVLKGTVSNLLIDKRQLQSKQQLRQQAKQNYEKNMSDVYLETHLVKKRVERFNQSMIKSANDFLQKLLESTFADLPVTKKQIDMLVLVAKCFTGNVNNWMRLFFEVFEVAQKTNQKNLPSYQIDFIRFFFNTLFTLIEMNYVKIAKYKIQRFKQIQRWTLSQILRIIIGKKNKNMNIYKIILQEFIARHGSDINDTEREVLDNLIVHFQNILDKGIRHLIHPIKGQTNTQDLLKFFEQSGNYNLQQQVNAIQHGVFNLDQKAIMNEFAQLICNIYSFWKNPSPDIIQKISQTNLFSNQTNLCEQLMLVAKLKKGDLNLLPTIIIQQYGIKVTNSSYKQDFLDMFLLLLLKELPNINLAPPMIHQFAIQLIILRGFEIFNIICGKDPSTSQISKLHQQSLPGSGGTDYQTLSQIEHSELYKRYKEEFNKKYTLQFFQEFFNNYYEWKQDKGSDSVGGGNDYGRDFLNSGGLPVTGSSSISQQGFSNQAALFDRNLGNFFTELKAEYQSFLSRVLSNESDVKQTVEREIQKVTGNQKFIDQIKNVYTYLENPLLPYLRAIFLNQKMYINQRRSDALANQKAFNDLQQQILLNLSKNIVFGAEHELQKQQQKLEQRVQDKLDKLVDSRKKNFILVALLCMSGFEIIANKQKIGLKVSLQQTKPLLVMLIDRLKSQVLQFLKDQNSYIELDKDQQAMVEKLIEALFKNLYLLLDEQQGTLVVEINWENLMQSASSFLIIVFNSFQSEYQKFKAKCNELFMKIRQKEYDYDNIQEQITQKQKDRNDKRKNKKKSNKSESDDWFDFSDLIKQYELKLGKNKSEADAIKKELKDYQLKFWGEWKLNKIYIDISTNIDFLINQIILQKKLFEFRLNPLIFSFKIQGFSISRFIGEFIPTIIDMTLAHFDQRQTQFLIKFCLSLQAFINFDFENVLDEFFLVFNINPMEIHKLRLFLIEFSRVAKAPLDYLDKKSRQALDFISAKRDGSHFFQFNKIKEKLSNEGNLLARDLFKLIDINGNLNITMFEFQLFFKKIGIHFSLHRIREIFAAVSQKNGGKITISKQELQLDEDEFEKAFTYILSQCTFLSLESLGITKERLMLLLIALVVLLILIIAFILVGVNAFAIPGAFGSIVNSIFPIAGGTGLGKSNQKDKKTITSLDKLKEVVQNSIKTIEQQTI